MRFLRSGGGAVAGNEISYLCNFVVRLLMEFDVFPVRRLGTIDDVANLAIFLADKDNSYIQGQTILMDGGRTIA